MFLDLLKLDTAEEDLCFWLFECGCVLKQSVVSPEIAVESDVCRMGGCQDMIMIDYT